MSAIIRPYLLLLCLGASLFLVPAACKSQTNDNPDFPRYEGSETTNFNEFYAEDDEDSLSSESYLDQEVSEEQPVVEPVKPQIKPGEPIKLEEKTIRIGRIPYMSIKDMMTQVVPLLSLLQKKTGAKEVRLVSSGTDYSSILTALANGKLDFAWVSPTVYVKCRDKDGLMAIAKAKFGNDTAFRGVFIAPVKGKVQGLEDLRGSSIGFVDPESASGHIYPMYLLKTLGIKLGKKTSIRFLKNHENVLRAVLSGKVDAGCLLEEILNSSNDKDLYKKIVVLAKTPEIPSDVIVCRQDCPINLRERFQEALVQIKADELPAKSPTFLTASDEEFAPVEAIMKFLGAMKK